MNAETAIPPRLTPWALAVLVLASGAAGCLSSETAPVSTSEAGPHAGNLTREGFSEGTTQAGWDLGDIPEGQEWILIEIVPEAYASLESEFDVELATDAEVRSGDAPDRAACVGTWLGGIGGPTFLHESSPNQGGFTQEADLVAQTSAVKARYEAQVFTSSFGIAHGLAAGGQANESVPFLFGVDNADFWKDEPRSNLWANVTSDTPFRWRTADAGQFECGYGVEDLDGGTVVRGPYVTYASDQTFVTTSERPGYLWLRGVADVAHDVTVSREGETLWASAFDTVQAGPGGGNVSDLVINATVTPIPPGEVRLDVDRFEGVRTVFFEYLWMEVPPWADAILHPQPALTASSG